MQRFNFFCFFFWLPSGKNTQCNTYALRAVVWIGMRATNNFLILTQCVSIDNKNSLNCDLFFLLFISFYWLAIVAGSIEVLTRSKWIQRTSPVKSLWYSLLRMFLSCDYYCRYFFCGFHHCLTNEKKSNCILWCHKWY